MLNERAAFTGNSRVLPRLSTATGDALVGFATIAASEVAAPRLTAPLRKGLPAYPLPVLRLARLAVDENARGRGAARALLRHTFALTHRMAEDMGCVGLVVDANPDAAAFYRGIGFMALHVRAGQLGDRPEPLPMFLELGAIPHERD